MAFYRTQEEIRNVAGTGIDRWEHPRSASRELKFSLPAKRGGEAYFRVKAKPSYFGNVA